MPPPQKKKNYQCNNSGRIWVEFWQRFEQDLFSLFFFSFPNILSGLLSHVHCTPREEQQILGRRGVVPLSRTDFFVDMSGQISSRRRQLSTKHWSRNKCGGIPTKIKTSSYAMDHRDWPGKQQLAEHLFNACRCSRLQHFSQTVKPF